MSDDGVDTICTNTDVEDVDVSAFWNFTIIVPCKNVCDIMNIICPARNRRAKILFGDIPVLNVVIFF